MSGEPEPVLKARWDLPPDATPEAIEYDRKHGFLVAEGWMRTREGRWLRPPFVVGTRPRSYGLEEAYLIARGESGSAPRSA